MPDKSALDTPESLQPTVVRLAFESPEGPEDVGLEAIPADVTGVAVQVTRMVVHDTRPGLFGSQKADWYPVFLLVAGPSDDPVTWNAQSFFNDMMPSDPAPISETAPPTVFRTFNQLPEYMDLHILLMRSRERSRETGKAIQELMASDEGQAVLTTIQTAVSASNPAAGVAVAAGKELLDLLGRYLSDRKDKQLFYTVGSFEKTTDLGIGLTHSFKSAGAEVDIEVMGLKGGQTP